MPITYAIQSHHAATTLFRTSRSCEPGARDSLFSPKHKLRSGSAGNTLATGVCVGGGHSHFYIMLETGGTMLTGAAMDVLKDQSQHRGLLPQLSREQNSMFEEPVHISNTVFMFLKNNEMISGMQAPVTVVTVFPRLQLYPTQAKLHRYSPLGHKVVNFRQGMRQNVTLLLLSFIFQNQKYVFFLWDFCLFTNTTELDGTAMSAEEDAIVEFFKK